MPMKNGNATALEDILTASGRNWKQWYSELNAIRFADLSCDEIEDALVLEYGIERNWARRITNRFATRKATDMERTVKPCFEISVKKTFRVPIQCVYSSASHWFDTEGRASDTSKIENNRLMCEWNTDQSKVAVTFVDKGNGRTQMISCAIFGKRTLKEWSKPSKTDLRHSPSLPE
jgi:hypothetical protein